MTIRRASTLASMVGMLACGRAAAPVQASPRVTLKPSAEITSALASASASAPASPPMQRDGVCEEVMRTQHDAAARAVASARAKSPKDWASVRAEKDPLALRINDGVGVACHPFTGGAWSLELHDVEALPLGAVPGIEGSLVPVAYVHGARVPSESIDTRFGYVSSVATDWDGDGIPELWLDVLTTGPEGGTSNQTRVLTISHGAIVRYTPSSAITMTGKPFDADHDGRLDLPTSDGVSIAPADDCEAKTYGEDANFIAHSLPDGTFSTTDAAAKSYARSWCPSSPTKIASARDALCARLWASTPATLAQERARVTACVPWDCDLEAQNKPQPKNATKDCTARLHTFDQKVPFTLP